MNKLRLPLNRLTRKLNTYFNLFNEQIHNFQLNLYTTISNITSNDFETYERFDSQTKIILTVANGDIKKLKYLKMYQSQIDLMFWEGKNVPSYLTKNEWQDLLSLEEESQRLKYLYYLWKMERFKIIRSKLKVLQTTSVLNIEKPVSKTALSTNGPILYAYESNSIFIFFSNKKYNQLTNFRLFQAMMFGPHIVFDLGYQMNINELFSCAYRLASAWQMNRNNFNPFYIICCNVTTSNSFLSTLKKFLPYLDSKDFPFTYTHQNFFDLLPLHEIIYLAPYCKRKMGKYKPNCVYVIGGYVTDGNTELDRACLRKAKSLKLKMSEFPIYQHVNWPLKSKNLTFPQVISILTDRRENIDWQTIFAKHLSFATKKTVTERVSYEDKLKFGLNFIGKKRRREEHRKSLAQVKVL